MKAEPISLTFGVVYRLFFFAGFISVTWELALMPAASRPTFILRKGACYPKVTPEHAVLSPSCDQSGGEVSPSRCMFTYLQALYAATPLLLLTRLFVLPLRDHVFLKSGELLTPGLPEHSFPYSPSLCANRARVARK